jgi:hypothetical protein
MPGGAGPPEAKVTSAWLSRLARHGPPAGPRTPTVGPPRGCQETTGMRVFRQDRLGALIGEYD